MGVFRVQSPCGLMADLPGNFEKALSGSCRYICNGKCRYLRYLPYLFFEGYLGSSHNCHLSFFRTYLKSISSSSDTSHGTIGNSRYAAVHSQFVEA